MRKYLIIPLLLAVISAAAQPVPDNDFVNYLRAFPQRASQNLHSYEFDALSDTPAPKGYKPFYISHYGRHGSRSAGDGHDYARLEKVLSEADADDQLTPDGKHLLDITRLVIERHGGMDGHLTPRGRREHATIAERMYRRYPEVFRKGSRKISAVSSTVPRCIVSMAAFTNKLKELQKDLDIDLDTGEKYMSYIGRGGSEKITSANRPIIDSLNKSLIPDTTSILGTIFKNPSAARKYVPSARKFQRDIFSTAKTCEAFDIDEDLFRLLPEGVVYRYSRGTSIYIYLNHANSEEAGDKRIPRAAPLADDIIGKADEVIAGAPRAADLRFGHDWPFVGLVCYFGLEGASERMPLEEACARWNASRFTPFAANLQLIFYRNKRGDILVKFLLNEKETLIPELTPVSGPYYRWEDVKSLCESRPKSYSSSKKH